MTPITIPTPTPSLVKISLQWLRSIDEQKRYACNNFDWKKCVFR